ncbi:MAG: LAGLIDADG family homing endonuclease [Nanoarchaeota archaeon]
MSLKYITKEDVKDYFVVEKKEDCFSLNISNMTKPIFVKLPFALNEDVASLAGLMPDGSLIRDLMRIYFHQKKDDSKIELFNSLIIRLFSDKILLFRKTGGRGDKQIYVNSKTLAWFFYYILKIPKSDEPMRVPNWIFESNNKVKTEYLKQAFDMEGTILKKLTEIRFVSKHELFVKDVHKLLRDLGIRSSITFTPRPKQISGQYRVSIYKKENFIKFKKIGFRIPFLKKRFDDLLEKYKI